MSFLMFLSFFGSFVIQPGLGDPGSMYGVQGSGARAGAKSLELLSLVFCVCHFFYFYHLLMIDLLFLFSVGFPQVCIIQAELKP